MRRALKHVQDEDLERYCLGTITEEAEIAPIEEHLMVCSECIDRAQAQDAYIRAVKGALKVMRAF